MYNPYNNFGYQNTRQPYYPQMYQQMPMQQQQNMLPVQDIKFLNADQIKSFIPPLGSTVALIDRDNRLLYLESADNFGNTNKQVYSFRNVSDPTEVQEPKFEIKKEDFSSLATKEDVRQMLAQFVEQIRPNRPSQQPQKTNQE